MSHEVARPPRVRVALVLDPGQPPVPREGLDLGPRGAEQRAEEHRGRSAPARGLRPHRRHSREPRGPGAARELEQHGLGLVVFVLREGDEVRRLRGEQGVAGRARRAFDAERVMRGKIGLLHRAAQRVPACGSAREPCPSRRIRADAVIDVQAVERERATRRERREQVEQYDRIDPARQGERQARAARNVAGKLRADALGEVT